MNKKYELKKFEKEMDKECISLTRFLMIYYGIYHEKLNEVKLSHDDIKTLIPNLKRVGFDYASANKYKLYEGEIIAVKDSFGHLCTYLCPKLENDIEPTTIDFETQDFKIKLKEIIQDENIQIYELKEICSKLKENSKYREYKVIKKLLKYRLSKQSKESKKYKQLKKELTLKENEKYEY